MLRVLEKRVPGIHTPPGGEQLEVMLGNRRPMQFSSGAPEPGDILIAGDSSSALDLLYHLAGEEIPGPWGSLICHTQWAGRGRRGRKWSSGKGNIFGALLLPEMPPSWENLEPLAAGFFISSGLSKRGFKTGVKWPNDLISSGRKIGGILVERKNGLTAAGIGINLNSSPGPEPSGRGFLPPGNLTSEGGDRVPPAALWEFLVKDFKKMYYDTVDKMSAEEFTRMLGPRLEFYGKKLRLLLPSGEIIAGFHSGLDTGGGLRVLSGGAQRVLTSAEIISAGPEKAHGLPEYTPERE